MTLFGLPEKYLIVMVVWIVVLIMALRSCLKLRRRAKDQPGKKRLANFGLSLGLLLFPLTLLELGFALFYDGTDSFNLSNVSQKWFTKYAQPDEKQLRFGSGETIVYRDDKEFPKKRDEGTTHVCFLGDSFTYGHGINRVADRFSNRVETQLNTESSQKTVVSNLGKPGSDLQYGEAILQKLFEDEIPVDVAIYTLCLNDIESFHPDFRTYYTSDWNRGSDFFLFRDTYFFNLLYFRWQQFQRPQVKNYYDFVQEYYADEPWTQMSEQLLSMKTLCAENGCEFQLVIFPFLHALGSDDGFAPIHAQIVTFCEENGIAVLDLRPSLLPHADEGLVISRFDAHPNVRANQIAAETIMERIKQVREGRLPD